MRALLVAIEKSTLSSLAATRALGQANWTVGIASPVRKGLAVSSRWAKYWHRVPSPTDDLDEFVTAINQAIQDNGYEVVFGAGDAELFALSYRRDEIRATVPYAAHGRLVHAFDKLTLADAASKVGLIAPRTVEASEAALASFAPRCIIKSRLHWRPENPQSQMRQQVRVASTHTEARQIIDDMRFRGGEPVIQEFIDGQLMGVTAITDKDSQMIAQLHQFAPLTWRPIVGEPTRAFTMPVDPILAGKVAALLSDLGWFGLVQLQFLMPEDGRPRLIDFNGRTYSTLALSTAAGINFQDLWGRLATDRKIETVGRAADGVRYQWMEGDLKRALTERRGGPARDVLSCFGYSPGAVHPVWTWRDPKPALQVPKILFAKWKNRLGSVAPKRA